MSLRQISNVQLCFFCSDTSVQKIFAVLSHLPSKHKCTVNEKRATDLHIMSLAWQTDFDVQVFLYRVRMGQYIQIMC